MMYLQTKGDVMTIRSEDYTNKEDYFEVLAENARKFSKMFTGKKREEWLKEVRHSTVLAQQQRRLNENNK